MEQPIGDCHLAGSDKSRGPREQASDQERAGRDFDDSSDTHEAEQRLGTRLGANREADRFDEAVCEKQRPRSDAQCCKRKWYEAGLVDVGDRHEISPLKRLATPIAADAQTMALFQFVDNQQKYR